MHIAPASTPDELADARALIAEYERVTGQDLSYQGLAGELDALPGDYAPPGGRLLVACAEGLPVGVIALRPCPSLGAGVCEMKRLYVRPAARGMGIGWALVFRLLGEASEAGYRTMVLDTLPELAAAGALYARAGFSPRARYNDDPHPETEYFEVALPIPLPPVRPL